MGQRSSQTAAESEADKHARYVTAMRQASIPTLLMCLVQISGDERWMEAPFLPKRDVSMFAEISGGLDENLQATVRHAVADVLIGLEAGRLQPAPLPDDAKFLRMMQVCVGEKMPPEYLPMALEEMGVRDRAIPWTHEAPPADLVGLSVLVIGAGVSGIAAAVRLKEMGIPFRVLEKNADVGGTWFENHYPDAGVDTPNHFYSYSFAPNLHWTGHYSKRDEVWGYLREVAAGLTAAGDIEFGSEVLKLVWHEDRQQWEATVSQADGRTTTHWARVVVSAVGQLNRPKAATFPGMETFTGESWHSARWRHDVPLEGRRVAVIGTGASAMQFVPRIAEQASHVTIFQRSPQWVREQPQYRAEVNSDDSWLMEHIPHYYPWYRFGLMWRFSDALLPSLRRDPKWTKSTLSVNQRNDRHREQLTQYLLQQLEGREDLIAKTLPDYPPYGKRMLIDNGWFDALKRPNVELVTEAVDHVDGGDVVTPSGARHAADVIVLATGFDAARQLGPMEVIGREGVSIRALWGEDNPKAYLGITAPGFPNFFVMYGPNTGLAHGGSLMFMAECQTMYLSSCLREMAERHISSVDVKPEVHDEYNDRVDAEHGALVWSHPGMRNWYRNAQGRVFGPVPWRLVDYWAMTRRADLSQYDVVTAPA